MLSCLATLWMATALAQGPDQSPWLKSVPADVAVVVRVKALETVRDDLLGMLGEMSGNAAAMARPSIEQGLEMMKAQSGKPSVEHPFFMLMSLPKDGPMPGWAVMVQSDSYEGVLKSITKKDDFKSNPKDGLDSFDSPDGQTWYATKGTGFVVFGPDQALVKGTIKPSVSLDGKITPEVKRELLGGDLGVYINIAAVDAQYSEQVEQAKQQLIGLLDQTGGQGMDAAKAMYGAMFDSVKYGDAIAFNLNFTPVGLGVSGMLTVKGDSVAAKNLATAKTGTAAGLAKLPLDGFSYSYMNPSAESIKAMSKIGLSMVTGGKSSPEIEKAQQLQFESGGAEIYQMAGSTGGGFGGMAALAFSTPTDPAKAVQAATMMFQALKTPDGMFKDVVLSPDKATHKGFKLNEVKITYNLEKMTPPNAPGGVEGMKKLMGGDTISSWYGTDGKTVLTVSGKTLDDAKAKIDAFLSGEGAMGKAPAFEALRVRFPEKVSMLMLVHAQGLVKFAAQTAGALHGNVPPIPADMPKEPALFGGSMTASTKGYQFAAFVPSNVGPVIEKGLVPVIQSLTGAIQ